MSTVKCPGGAWDELIANTGSILYLTQFTLCFFCSAASLLSVAASFFLWSLYKYNVLFIIIHAVTTQSGLQGVSDLTTYFLLYRSKYNQERIRMGGLSKSV